LRWATRKENIADQIIHGTGVRGERTSKLTEKDVIEIRKLASTMSQPAIADRFGVNSTTICRIVNYINWAWLESPDFKYNGPQLF
jgi:hypothetical protein